MLSLSKRLYTIATLVPFGARVCDIGADHGYLSIYIAKEKKPLSVITTDINEKPLEKAKENSKLAKIKNIDFRLCDGLCGIKENEIDTAIIAGMGGEVISGILDRGKNIVKNTDVTLILQPTTSPEFLRKFLYNNGFFIEKEIPIFENQKLYSVMLVKYSGEIKNQPDYFYFIGNITPDTEEGFLYIKKQYDRCFKCMKSLEKTYNTENFSFHKSICDSITDYLKNFGVEYSNGI
ncbi:MAG: SAM-dependent methyltransferase [Clostridia bacterium]|nr:SAM-dependent methyltransferase [Clostridia bacterium]MBR4973530.1 SAM-dependent methyltransferase [Clostridia bacterium]